MGYPASSKEVQISVVLRKITGIMAELDNS
jgi:hypothetical protein